MNDSPLIWSDAMNKRIMLPISFVLLALLTLILAGCERDRPVDSTQATAVPARGTVAPSPTLAATVTGAEAAAPTAAPTSATSDAAATPTAPAPQPAAAGQGTSTGAATGQESTYTVVAGDTLATIAAKYGVTQAALVQLNNLTDPNKLVLGQQLKIPAGATAGAAAPTAAAGSSTAGGTSTYVVQRGDTLGQIAQRHNTSVAELMRLNNITNPDRITVGQKLTVPGAASRGQAPATTSGSSQTRTYVVQRGDTLLSIARRFGLTVRQLQAANNIANPDRIFPGQTLTIP
jgi:LysM repeat protein